MARSVLGRSVYDRAELRPARLGPVCVRHAQEKSSLYVTAVIDRTLLFDCTREGFFAAVHKN